MSYLLVRASRLERTRALPRQLIAEPNRLAHTCDHDSAPAARRVAVAGADGSRPGGMVSRSSSTTASAAVAVIAVTALILDSGRGGGYGGWSGAAAAPARQADHRTAAHRWEAAGGRDRDGAPARTR